MWPHTPAGQEPRIDLALACPFLPQEAPLSLAVVPQDWPVLLVELHILEEATEAHSPAAGLH